MSNSGETLSQFRLSLSEKNILSHVLRGHSNKIIAQDLGVTEAAAKAQLESVLRRINVEDRTQAAIWALANVPELDTSLGALSTPGEQPSSFPPAVALSVGELA